MKFGGIVGRKRVKAREISRYKYKKKYNSIEKLLLGVGVKRVESKCLAVLSK